MIINPKNAPSSSDLCQQYISYIDRQVSEFLAENCSLTSLCDLMYTLGEVDQESLNDDQLLPGEWTYIKSYLDNVRFEIRRVLSND